MDNSPEEPTGGKDRFLQVAVENFIFWPKLRSCPFHFTDPPLAPPGPTAWAAGAEVPVELCLLEKLLLSDTIHPIPGRVMGTLFAAAGAFLPLSWVSSKLR